jgi:hypothetical protein
MGCISGILGIVGIIRLWGTPTGWLLVALYVLEWIYVGGMRQIVSKEGTRGLTGGMVFIGTALQVAIVAIAISSFFK